MKITQTMSFASDEEHRKQLLSVIVGLHLGFRSVENPLFKQYVTQLSNGLHHLPSATAMRNELRLQVAIIEKQLLEGLVDGSKVSLSIDCWTSPNKHAFMGVLVNYITKAWKLEHSLIGFEHLTGIHSGAELSKVLKSLLTKFELEDRTIAITTDNASNNGTMLKEMQQMLKQLSSEDEFFKGKIQHVPCLSHIIQLGLQALLGEIRLKPTNAEILKVWNETEQLAELDRAAAEKGIAFTLAKVSYSNLYSNLYSNCFNSYESLLFLSTQAHNANISSRRSRITNQTSHSVYFISSKMFQHVGILRVICSFEQ
jgi:hypothetical protein